MTTFVVRVWLPDRPGALGAIASRIGAVRGDLVGIDILERGANQAIDELIVELPSDDLVALLTRELEQVDGVHVEEIRPLSGVTHDPRLDALETAITLVEAHSVEALLQALAGRAGADFECAWTVVFDHDAPVPLASFGRPPDSPWLAAFVSGSQASSSLAPRGAGSLDAPTYDVTWASLGTAELTLVMGRPGRPFRSRERRQATALARIADARWAALVGAR